MVPGGGIAAHEIIESRDELVRYLEAGCKPYTDWRIGTEHEQFPYYTAGHHPVPYDGLAGIGSLLEELCSTFGWHPIRENGAIIALRDPDNDKRGTITLEPGGQFELSGVPLRTLHETHAELTAHMHESAVIGEALGIGFLDAGFSPKWTLAETPRMPKGRYAIMSGYMPKVGTRGLDMMYRTCTVQANFDFSSEADMVKKVRVGLALQPVMTALFANSPFTEGRPNGYLSLRSEVWRDTDPARTGMLPFTFEDGMGFERYTDYVLDVPMYFVHRDGEYIDASGASFRDFMDGRLPQMPGERPTMEDWADHLTTIFPEVRLKRYLEMRGADSGPLDKRCAVPAVWTGLFYDSAALEAAWALVRDWTAEERQTLRDTVPRQALKTPFRGGTLGDVARDVVAIARDGLRARGLTDPACEGETRYLEPLETIAASGVTSAEILLERYHGEWGGNVDTIFEAHG
ncbi:MAG: glutamate--cysteine ligase [Alphaproteobacteria bacterium]